MKRVEAVHSMYREVFLELKFFTKISCLFFMELLDGDEQSTRDALIRFYTYVN